MNRLQANLCLLCVTLFWSSEVIIYSCIPEGVPAFATTCVTALIGAALLAAPFHRRVLDALRAGGVRLVLAGLGLAALNSSYNTLYLFGMKSLDVASSAFTLSMTVVVLPVVLLSMHRRVAARTWVSVALVLSGIVLALGKSAMVSANAPALGIIVGGCLLRAVMIVLLADIVKKHDPLVVTVLFEMFVVPLSLIGWFFEDPRLFAGLHLSRTLVSAWALYAYFIVAFATTLNTFSMRRVSATNATVIYSMEIVFSLAWGALLPGGIVERIAITPRIAIGAVLVVAGALAEIFNMGGKRKEAQA
ncbi:MAG: DMT family transporter [Kiritimatiellae bacterium]|nr:DMT family transporter [Kiritimatiellia bacterium]